MKTVTTAEINTVHTITETEIFNNNSERDFEPARILKNLTIHKLKVSDFLIESRTLFCLLA